MNSGFTWRRPQAFQLAWTERVVTRTAESAAQISRQPPAERPALIAAGGQALWAATASVALHRWLCIGGPASVALLPGVGGW